MVVPVLGSLEANIGVNLKDYFVIQNKSKSGVKHSVLLKIVNNILTGHDNSNRLIKLNLLKFFKINKKSIKSMYENLKIGIVEDDQLTAEMIKNTLSGYGYDSPPSVGTYLKAVKMIKKESPDLLLIDICLDGKRDGVDLGQTINKKYQVPFIFITSHTNKEVVERAKNVYPQAYLTKPFTAEELKCALEICLNNRVAHIDSFESSKNAIFLKDGHYFYKFKFEDIMYIEGDHSNSWIQTSEKKVAINLALNELMLKLDEQCFFKVSNNLIANIEFIQSVGSDYIIIDGNRIPASKKYLDIMLDKFQIF